MVNKKKQKNCKIKKVKYGMWNKKCVNKVVWN